MPSPTVTKTATQTNPSTRMSMATHRCWLLHIWWTWVLSHCRLLHQKCHSLGRYNHHIVMLPKASQCSSSCSPSMGFLKQSNLTGPQFASHQFTEFAKEWNFDHTTSSPSNPRSNGQAEAAVKVVKGHLTRAKYSGQDPYLALLAYRSTPIDAHLHSPAEMLYQRVIKTTVPQRIRHKDPQAAADWDHLNDCATQSAAYHDCHCKPKSPLDAGQTISVLNDAKTFWLPATVICQARHGSYLVQVIGGGQYRCARDHIHERHPDAVKPDVLTNTNVAPATPESSHGLFPVRPVTAAPGTAPVASATPKLPAVPTATRPMDTPRKPPTAVVLQNPSTRSATKVTGAAPAATCWSTRVRKPPTQFFEMWPGPPLAGEHFKYFTHFPN